MPARPRGAWRRSAERAKRKPASTGYNHGHPAEVHASGVRRYPTSFRSRGERRIGKHEIARCHEGDDGRQARQLPARARETTHHKVRRAQTPGGECHEAERTERRHHQHGEHGWEVHEQFWKPESTRRLRRIGRQARIGGGPARLSQRPEKSDTGRGAEAPLRFRRHSRLREEEDRSGWPVHPARRRGETTPPALRTRQKWNPAPAKSSVGSHCVWSGKNVPSGRADLFAARRNVARQALPAERRPPSGDDRQPSRPAGPRAAGIL